MIEDELPTPRNLVLIAVLFEGGLGVVAVVFGWLLGYPPLEQVEWAGDALAWGAAASVPPMGLLWIGIRVPLGPFRDLLRVVDELLVPMFRDCRVLELAVISALAGLGEEMLFRGVLQAGVADLAAGWLGDAAAVWVGLGVASVLFGLAHLITPTYAVLAALIGLYLGGLWLATDNLLVPIATHATYDFFALVYLAKIRSRGRGSEIRGRGSEAGGWGSEAEGQRAREAGDGEEGD